MANRLRAVEEARRRWARERLELGDQLRSARRLLGTTQDAVGRALNVSGTEVGRRELGRSNAPFGAIMEHAAVVGLRLSVKAYPVGGGLRDMAQVSCLHRFLSRITHAFQCELEAVIPLPGDLRAIDAVLRAPGAMIAVEVVTRLGDVQAQLRAARLKARDIGATRGVIVVAATRANRRALDEARAVVASAYDLDTRRVLAALAAGRQPERDALVLI